MTKLHDMSIPELFSLLSKLEKIVKIMAFATAVYIIFYILNHFT